MFEDTNQTETQTESAAISAEEELFADYTPEDTHEGDTNQSSENENRLPHEEEDENQVESSEAAPDRYKVVYNGQEVSLTLDELKTNAQKGMNYDHIYGQLQKMKDSPALSVFERYARRNGMNIEQYAEYLQKLETQQRVTQMTQEGIPETTAKRLIELEEKESARSEREAQAQNQEKMQQQFSEFLKEYPNVQAADIPQEVWQRFNTGMDLLPAYAIYENKLLKAEVQQHLQNERNRQKSVGSIHSENTEANTDAFLDGLFG